MFDAARFVPVLNAIQRITFNFASDSYASLETESGAPNGNVLGDFQQHSQSHGSVPPVSITIGTMADSQLQVGAGIQTGTFGAVDQDALLSVVHDLIAALPNIGLNEADYQEAKAEASTIQAQLGSSRPKASVIHESLATLRRILEGAVGSAAATGFAQSISTFL